MNMNVLSSGIKITVRVLAHDKQGTSPFTKTLYYREQKGFPRIYDRKTFTFIKLGQIRLDFERILHDLQAGSSVFQ